MTTFITEIPLKHLHAGDNIRRAVGNEGVAELAASIAAHGLLQSLVVRIMGGAEYEVVAGNRRLAALELLQAGGQIAGDRMIPCHIIADDDDAEEISLAENVVREPMHPADEFEAFRALIDKGTPIADIAARFGVSETVVKKRLKLANLAPDILAAYRDGKLTLSHVQAFAASDDHERQLKIFDDFDPEYEGADDIRTALTEGKISATDKRVKFVTLPVYEQAGGAVSRDLFATDESGIFIEDPALLDRLVTQQLEAEAAALRAQGWSWVDIEVDFKYSDKRTQIYPAYAPIPPDAQAEIARLEEEATALENELDEVDDDARAAEIRERLGTIETRIGTLEATPEIWTPEIMQSAGMVLSLEYDGDLARRGFQRNEDKKSAAKNSATGDDNDADDDADGDDADEEESGEGENASTDLPASLLGTLTAHRSAALAATLADKPDIALAVLVHALGRDLLYDAYNESKSCAEITAIDNTKSLPPGIDVDTCRGYAEMVKEREAWAGTLPATVDAFWPWCLKQKRQKLLNLLAYLTAKTIDAVCRNPRRLHEADALAEVLQLDMTAFFTPTTENYFKHVGKITILSNLAEALTLTEIPAAWQNLSQKKLAEIAEREIAGTGWLPEPLRAPPEPAAEAEESGDDEEEDGEN